MTKVRRRILHEGDRFRMHPDTGDRRLYECVRVTPGSAIVRCIDKTETTFETADGEDVTFARPGRRFTICPAPLGITLEAPDAPAQ
jgi:hypothetical protein